MQMVGTAQGRLCPPYGSCESSEFRLADVMLPPPVYRSRIWLVGAGIIWVDQALCRAPLGRHLALRDRCEATRDVVGTPRVHLDADRVVRIVRLRTRRHRS